MRGSRLVSAARAAFVGLFSRKSGLSSHELYAMLGRGSRSSSGAYVNESSAMQVATVAACVRLKSNIISTLPVDLIERVDERTRRPASNHPARRLLTRPNSWQTWSDWLGQQSSHIELRGNGYSLIVRSGRNAAELIPMHPDQVVVEQKPYPDLSVSYIWTSKNGQRLELDGRNVLHLLGMSTDGLMGRSVIEDARDSIGVAIATQEHAGKLWRRSGVPMAVLTHPKTLGDIAAKGIEDRFIATYGGGADQRLVAVLEEGMEMKPLSLSETDSQFLETRGFQRSEICGLFGVPPHLIGDTEKSTSWGTGIEQQQIGFVSLFILPLLVKIEQRMHLSLLNADEKFAFKFYTQGLMRADVSARGMWYRTMREIGAYSANDIRRLEDEPPIENGDTYLQPLNLAPLGTVPAQRPTA